MKTFTCPGCNRQSQSTLVRIYDPTLHSWFWHEIECSELWARPHTVGEVQCSLCGERIINELLKRGFQIRFATDRVVPHHPELVSRRELLVLLVSLVAALLVVVFLK